MEEKQTKNQFLLPAAILIGFALIAGAIYFSGTETSQVVAVGDTYQPTTQPPLDTTNEVRPVDDTDHIKGNPEASITIVEYSDFECPFCKRFHDTMNEVMEETDDVTWVLRQFPLDQLHPLKARAEAVASECVAELGGNDVFWQFADRFMELTPSNNRTDIEAVIPQIVREIGLDENTFNTCFESGRYDEHIEADIENAIATGGRGTPWSIIINDKGATFPINGALPKEAILQAIAAAKVN